jgi:HPr kinase/phosphorylase
MVVRELLSDQAAEPLGLTLLAGGEGLDNVVNRPRIQKPGLALAGFLEYIHPGRVQILGKSEITFLSERGPAERHRIVSQLCRQGVSCFVLTTGLTPRPSCWRRPGRTRSPCCAPTSPPRR